VTATGRQAEQEITVWLIRTDLPDALLADLERLADPAERDRAALGARDGIGRRYLAAHGAFRVIAGGRLGVAPESLRWRHGRHGKPYVAWPDTALQVSMSGSGTLAAIALCDGRSIGVDIQRVAPGTDVSRMAARFYPRDEAARIGRARPAERIDLFFRLWARKEACIKVAGDRLIPGLRLPTLDIGAPVRGDQAGPLPGPYLVADLTAPPGYHAAVAAEGSAPYRVRTRWWPDGAARQDLAEPVAAERAAAPGPAGAGSPPR